ncbi:hypothetical protein V6N13_009782 [Hibiscus sabdariffa]
MGVSNMKTWLVCMAIICMVAAVEVLRWMRLRLRRPSMEELLISVSTVVFSKFLLIPGPVAARESLGAEVVVGLVSKVNEEYFGNEMCE